MGLAHLSTDEGSMDPERVKVSPFSLGFLTGQGQFAPELLDVSFDCPVVGSSS
jgi:hypothetical protein